MTTTEGKGGGRRLVSIDPDDAVSGVVYLEDALRSYRDPEDADSSTVYSINPCYYLIPQTISTIHRRTRYSRGKITAVSMTLGMDNFRRRYGDAISVIADARLDVMSRGGCWEEKEFLHGKLRADFHTSKLLHQWSVRVVGGPVESCDDVADEVGVGIHHLRQIILLAGLMQSTTIHGKDQQKMIEVVKWFGGVLEEKAGVAQKVLNARRSKTVESVDRLDDPWDVI